MCINTIKAIVPAFWLMKSQDKIQHDEFLSIKFNISKLNGHQKLLYYPQRHFFYKNH